MGWRFRCERRTPPENPGEINAPCVRAVESRSRGGGGAVARRLRTGREPAHHPRPSDAPVRNAMTPLPASVPTVRDLAALLAALDAGVETIVSIPGGGGSLGGGVWAAMVAAARAARPGRAFVAVLDCADRPGHVLAAWRAGVTDVAFAAGAPAAPRLVAIAAEAGLRLWASPSVGGIPARGSLQDGASSANQAPATPTSEQRDVR